MSTLSYGIDERACDLAKDGRGRTVMEALGKEDLWPTSRAIVVFLSSLAKDG